MRARQEILAYTAVLTGRVVQEGERQVIKIELVDAIDGSHLWGESYSCERSEILGIEAEISRTGYPKNCLTQINYRREKATYQALP